jgi:hypothetical protein
MSSIVTFRKHFVIFFISYVCSITHHSLFSDFHIIKAFNNFPDCILLSIRIFERFSYQIEHQQHKSTNECPDIYLWVLVALSPLNVFLHLSIINFDFICFKPNNGLSNFIYVNGVVSFFQGRPFILFVIIVLKFYRLVLEEVETSSLLVFSQEVNCRLTVLVQGLIRLLLTKKVLN